MKDALMVTYNGEKFRLSAHELINYAVGIVKKMWEGVPRERIMRGPNKGRFYFPIEFPTNINELVNCVADIKPGFSKNEKIQAKKNGKTLFHGVRNVALQHYSKLFLEVVKEPSQSESWEGWNYKKFDIEEAAKKTEVNQSVPVLSKNDCEAMTELNQYIDGIDESFLQLYIKKYHNKILREALKANLMNLSYFLDQCIIECDDCLALLNQCVKIPTLLELNSSDKEAILKCIKDKKLGHHSENLDEAIAFMLNLIKIFIGNQVNFSSFLNKKSSYEQICIMTMLSEKIHHKATGKRQALEKLVSSLNLEKEEFPNWEGHYKNIAKKMIGERRKLFILYNWIFYIRELDKNGKIVSPKNYLDKIQYYVSIINGSLEAAGLGKLIVTMADYNSFIRLLLKQDQGVRECLAVEDEGKLRGAFVNFFSNRTKTGPQDLFSLLEGCEFCKFACEYTESVKDKVKAGPFSERDMALVYFRIGNRIIGIEDNGSRYVYDFGILNQSAANIFIKLEDIEEESKNNIKSRLKEADSSDQFFKIFSDVIEEASRKLAAVDEKFSKKLVGRIHGFNKSTSEKLELYDDIASKKIVFEFEACSFIEGLFYNFKDEFMVESRGLDSFDKQSVTYPALCKSLQTMPPNEFAFGIRSLLQGEFLKISSETQERDLSVLTATWFLAEVGRNPFSCFVSLMLLDLMENNLTYGKDKLYQTKNVICTTDKNLGSLKVGNAVDSTLAPYQNNELTVDGWGGKHPMCHTGSFLKYFSDDNPELWKVSDDLEMVRQKEVAILIHWLLHHLKSTCEVETTSLSDKSKEEKAPFGRDQFLLYRSYKISKEADKMSFEVKERFLEEQVKPLIIARLSSFDNVFNKKRLVTEV